MWERVAAYLAPYKDSSLKILRGSIQAVGLDAARLVFYGGAQTPGAAKAPAEVESASWVPNYSEHRAGGTLARTVLAYDTLEFHFQHGRTTRAIRRMCLTTQSPERAL